MAELSSLTYSEFLFLVEGRKRSFPHSYLSIPQEQWEYFSQAHHKKFFSLVKKIQEQRSRHLKHPVYDFLFSYYSFRPGLLLRWSPGFGVLLENASVDLFSSKLGFSDIQGGRALSSINFPSHRRPFLQWLIRYLEGVQHRSPRFHCFGLHEWAMVYRSNTVRHSDTPLRLSLKECAEVVESLSLQCSHYDAFRFFTPEALPRNRFTLTRATQSEFDQPGCIHVIMDLYRFTYKLYPWIQSSLLADTFFLAREAREIDMRASPYELTQYGFMPIRIETEAGRKEYQQYQQQLFEKSMPLRARVLEEVKALQLFVTE